MAARSNAPIIIKRKKKVSGEAHHGGAWKVAYADFVTAMMAFFLLMWLLNASSEAQRGGIADYFAPSVSITRTSGGGKDVLSGDNMVEENVLTKTASGADVKLPVDLDSAAGDTGDSTQSEAADAESRERQAFSAIEDMLVGSGGESMVSEQLLRHVVTRQTDEGLIVELFDLPGAPLFAADGATPTRILKRILAQLAPVFALVTNDVAISGHVAAQPVVRAHASPWTLSADRAEQTRRGLEGGGLQPSRMERVTGYADRSPALEDPMSVRNNRLEITLLRNGR